MATIAEVVTKVLKKLRVIEEDETPSTSAVNDITASYNELHPWLLSRSAVNWDGDDDIPDEAVIHVVRILAANMADDFSIPEGLYQRLQIEAFGHPGDETGDNALTRLVVLAAGPYIPSTTKATYY